MAEESKTVREALDKIRQAQVPTVADGSNTLLEALNGIRDAIAVSHNAGAINYPRLVNGPVELVLAFNNDEFIKLKGPADEPYFSSHGPLTDLHGIVLPGSRVATTFPVDPTKFGETVTWPLKQKKPFDTPPVNEQNTTNHGYSKQAYFFNDNEDSFVTVGPSLPKITRTKNGGAQFWVGSIGVITQGTGKYEGAKGVTTYVGSGYFDVWPDSFEEQIKLLRAGFKALVGTYVKVVFKQDVG